MYLIQLLLPLHDNNKQKFPDEYYRAVRNELTERFGGVTAFLRSPAVGLWKQSEDKVNRDEVVMFEAMSSELDEKWWAEYRKTLQDKFRQEELLVWALDVRRL